MNQVTAKRHVNGKYQATEFNYVTAKQHHTDINHTIEMKHKIELHLNTKMNDEKKQLAAQIYDIIKPFGKLTFAFGGFAAHLHGSTRNINDLDIFVNFDHPDITFIDGGRGTRILEMIDARFRKEFGKNYGGMQLTDDCTVTATCNGILIDIACRPALFKHRSIEKYRMVPIDDVKIRVECPLDVVMGKGYAFVFREKTEKRITDLFDMISMISNNKDLENWYTKLNGKKGEAYDTKFKQLKKEGSFAFMKPTLLDQFHVSLNEFVRTLKTPETLKAIKNIFGAERQPQVVRMISDFHASMQKVKAKSYEATPYL